MLFSLAIQLVLQKITSYLSKYWYCSCCIWYIFRALISCCLFNLSWSASPYIQTNTHTSKLFGCWTTGEVILGLEFLPDKQVSFYQYGR